MRLNTIEEFNKMAKRIETEAFKSFIKNIKHIKRSGIESAVVNGNRSVISKILHNHELYDISVDAIFTHNIFVGTKFKLRWTHKGSYIKYPDEYKTNDEIDIISLLYDIMDQDTTNPIKQ